MKCPSLLLLSLVLTFPPLWAEDAGPVPVLESTTHLSGTRTKVVWSPRSNVFRYRVEKSTDLSSGSGGGAGGWSTRAVVESGEWVDPEPPGARAFYRVPEPPPEVWGIYPPVLSTQGGLLTLEGQCLPPGSALVFDMETGPPLVLPLLAGEPGTYRAMLSAGVANPTIGVISGRIVDSGGSTIVVLDGNFEIHDSSFTADVPPYEPPASPLGMAINEKGLPGEGKPHKCACATCKNKKVHARMAGGGGDGDCDDSDAGDYDATLLMPALMKAKEKANRTKCSNHLRFAARAKTSEAKISIGAISRGLPGEVTVDQDILTLATPAGPDLSVSLHYRSRAGTGDIPAEGLIRCGAGWTCSYDLRIVPVPLAAGASAPRLYLFGGDGRRDVLVRQPDGSYRGNGMFREGRFDPDTTFRLTFADQSQFIFCRLVGAPWSGRIGSIADANGVAVNFLYNGASQLDSVTSQFGQSLTFAYTPTGELSTVTDHTGRFVECSYFAAGETGGNPGDLKSVSCPQLPGQLPLEGASTFTYAADPDHRLRNLLTARDGAGRLIAEYGYSSSTSTGDADFDACDEENLHSTSSVPLNFIKITYEDKQHGRTMILCDETGRVAECDFDFMHRCVAVRQFTGFAVPGVPVTATNNRPTGKLRSTDPDYFETKFRYNGDSCVTRITHPGGLEERFVYGRDLRRDCPVRERGNAHLITLRTPGGEERTVSCDYLPGFGSPESGGLCDRRLPVRNIGSSGEDGVEIKWPSVSGSAGIGDGSGFGTVPVGDFASNPIPGIGEVVKRNPGSSSAALVSTGGGSVWPGEDGNGGCTDAMAIWAGRKGYQYYMAKSDLTAAGSHSNPYFHGNGMSGDMVLRRKGWNGTVKGRIAEETGAFRKILDYGEAGDNVGLSLRIRHRGWDGTIKGRPPEAGRLIIHQDTILEPMESFSTSGEIKIKHKGWDGLIYHNHRTRLVTSHGQVFTWSYDPIGNLLACRTPVEGSGCDMTYNPLGQLRSVTVLNGSDGSFREEFNYDAATGWLLSHVTDPDVSGTGDALQLTTTISSRSPLGHITGCVDPRGNEWLIDYDACDRIRMTQSPPVGTSTTGAPVRIAARYYFDPGGSCVRCDVDHLDAAGVPDAANPVITTWLFHDSRGRVERCATEQQPDSPPAASSPVLSLPVLNEASYSIIDFHYNESGECHQATVPAASRGQSTNNVCLAYFDERGKVWRLTRGAPGAPSSVTVQTDYTPFGMVSRRMLLPTLPPPTSPPLPQVSWDYDDFLRLESFTDAMGNVTSCDYDEQGFVTVSVMGEVNDGPGSAGNVLLARTRGRASMSDISISSKGKNIRKNITVNLRAALFTTFVKDDVCTTERFAPGTAAPHETETLTVTRSAAGLVQSVARNGDTLLSCAYDTASRLSVRQDARVTVACVPDACGNIISVTRTEHSTIPGAPPKSFTCTATFDALHRCTSTTDGSGNVFACDYDSLSRPVLLTDPRGTHFRCRYDYATGGAGTLPEPVSFSLDVDADNDGIMSIDEELYRAHCPSGECRSYTDSNGYVTLHTRDSGGNLVQCDFPDATHEIYGFDTFGRPASITHRDGAVTVATLDADGRPVVVTCDGGTPGTIPALPIEYTWNGLSYCVRCRQGESDLICTWDSLGNQLSESHNGHVVTRTFNERGRSSITYPDGTTFIEVRDQFGNAQSVSLLSSTGAVLTPPVSQCDYLGHRCVRETRANGVVTTFTYRGDGDAPLPGGAEDFSFDACVQMTSSHGGSILQVETIRRNPNQSVTQCDTSYSGESAAPGRRQIFTLDRLERVTRCITRRREVAGGPLVLESDVSHTLDLAGSRLSTTGGANPGAYTQNASLPPGDHQMGQYSSWPGGSLEWGDDGNLNSLSRSSGVSTQMLYNSAGQLVAVTNASTGEPLATYAYDGKGRRTRSSTPGSAVSPPEDTFFIYDGSVCVQEIGGDSLPNFTYGAVGIGPCISTRNGTIIYPRGGGTNSGGGGSSAKFNYPILKAEIVRLKEIEVDDDIHLRMAGSGGGDGVEFYTDSTGTVTERRASNEAGQPIFLTSDGLPRPGATDLLSGYRWMAPECIWCPESRFLMSGATSYSPELGTIVAKEKKKPKDTGGTAVKGSWNLKENVK